ncbi:putative GTPase activating protein for Arf-domain-containing protein, partial [Vararia minispora EC-137]
MASVSRLTAEKNAKAVHEIALLPGNDRCADCKTRNPRWASHNLGIFICVSCASIHRKIGTHITKVKSLTLDSWTKEQVDNMRNIGNIKSNQYFNPDEVRHPPPTNLVDSERDGELEKFIRDKYEFKRFINKSAVVQQHLGPSRSAASIRDHPPTRSATAPLASSNPSVLVSPTAAPTPTTTFASQQPHPSLQPATSHAPLQRSATNPFPQQPFPTSTLQVPPAQSTGPTGGMWSDLISLQTPQAPAVNASLPLQYTVPPSQPMTIPSQQTSLSPASYLGSELPGTSSSFAASTLPNFSANTVSNFAVSSSPGFAANPSPNFADAAGP